MRILSRPPMQGNRIKVKTAGQRSNLRLHKSGKKTLNVIYAEKKVWKIIDTGHW